MGTIAKLYMESIQENSWAEIENSWSWRGNAWMVTRCFKQTLNSILTDDNVWKKLLVNQFILSDVNCASVEWTRD